MEAWPDSEMDPAHGVQLDTIQAPARYGATDDDWRAARRHVPRRRPRSKPAFFDAGGVEIPAGVTGVRRQ
jgi:hypothetical protein